MSNFATDPKIELIRKLLKQAEGAARLGHQAEADAFNERAVELIAKYGVDQALLAAEGKIEDPILSRHIAIAEDFALDRRALMFAIVRGLNCKAVYNARLRPGTTKSYTYTMHVFAHQSDMERIIFLFDLLQPQMLVGAAAAQVPSWENARSYRKSWMSGFSAAIEDRLSKNEKKAIDAASTGTDIVLFNRSSAVVARFEVAYPSKSLTKSYRRLSGSGRANGYAAGQRANIGNTVGGSRTAIAG